MLTVASPSARWRPLMSDVTQDTSGPSEELIPMLAITRTANPASGAPRIRQTGTSAMAAPPSSHGPAMCQRRSPERDEWSALAACATAPQTYGAADSSAACEPVAAESGRMLLIIRGEKYMSP